MAKLNFPMDKRDIKIILEVTFIFILLGIGFWFGRCSYPKESNQPDYITDTFYLDTIIYDTITKNNPYPVQNTIIDTIEIPFETKDTMYLPKIQKTYDDSLWSVWISGVEPLSLDSIHLFTPKEKEFIKITEKVNVIDNKFHLYGGIGIYTFYEGISTDLIVSTQFRNKWILGGRIGLYNNKVNYGLSVQYKIF